MEYNYAKLTGKIVEVCGTRENYAKAMGWSPKTVTEKLNNNSPFKTTDIEKTIAVLGIDRSEIVNYFFDIKTRKIRAFV